MQPPAAYIFDMDGVIVDSTGLHTEAWIAFLRSHGLHLPDIAERMLGKHNDAIVREFFSNSDLTDEEIFIRGAEKEKLYRDLMRPVIQQHLVPGITDFLDSFTGEVPAAVATNAEKANVDFVLDEANLRQHFQVILSGHDVKRPKPAPDIYLRAAELLRIDPECCIVWEDSLTGAAAARAAGMRVVGVSTTLTEFPDVDLVIRDFSDAGLRSWLQSFNVCV